MSIEEGQEDVLEIALQEKLVKKGQKIISCNDEGHFSEGLKRAQARAEQFTKRLNFVYKIASRFAIILRKIAKLYETKLDCCSFHYKNIVTYLFYVNQ